MKSLKHIAALSLTLTSIMLNRYTWLYDSQYYNVEVLVDPSIMRYNRLQLYLLTDIR